MGPKCRIQAPWFDELTKNGAYPKPVRPELVEGPPTLKSELPYFVTLSTAKGLGWHASA